MCLSVYSQSLNSVPQIFHYFLSWFFFSSSSVDFIMWYTCHKELPFLKSFLINNTYESSSFILVLNHFKINRLISNMVNYYHNHFKKIHPLWCGQKLLLRYYPWQPFATLCHSSRHESFSAMCWSTLLWWDLGCQIWNGDSRSSGSGDPLLDYFT